MAKDNGYEECASFKHNMGATKHTIINATVKRNWRDHVNIFIYFQLILNAADFPYTLSFKN